MQALRVGKLLGTCLYFTGTFLITDFSSINGDGPFGPNEIFEGLAQSRAALLLVESLMHALVAKGTISREEIIEIVEGSAEVEHELMALNASYPPNHNASLLYSLAAAFKKELGR